MTNKYGGVFELSAVPLKGQAGPTKINNWNQ